MAKTPSKIYTCTACATQFVAKGEILNGVLGKRCPNGHFNNMSVLRKPSKNKFIADKQLPVTKATGDKVTAAERALLDSFGTEKVPLRKFGIVGRIQELELALQLMLDTYDSYSHTVAPSHKLSAMFEGAFAAHAELAKRILHK